MTIPPHRVQLPNIIGCISKHRLTSIKVSQARASKISSAREAAVVGRPDAGIKQHSGGVYVVEAQGRPIGDAIQFKAVELRLICL
jgi:hypothetical protein